MRSFLLTAICLMALFSSICTSVQAQIHFDGDYSQRQLQWVETKIKNMDLDEKIGKLFMVAAYSNRGEAHKVEITKLIRDFKIGGLIFFQGTPEAQVKLTNHFQTMSKTPLLIAIDGEWGLSMRLSNTPKYPRQLTLGAIQNNDLIYAMGKDIARQCKRMGIHVNLAPVVDVNNNPNNPVINDRSFGENPRNVSDKSIAYMNGMEQSGVLACAKHFPGHGDTDKDSHHTLPVIRHSRERMDSIELYPFREMAKRGVGSMMSAHLAIPSLDSRGITDALDADTPTMPASLSAPILEGILRGELGYEGLLFTDALNMKGVSKFFAPGEVDLMAFEAGNDILLFPEDVGKAVSMFKEAVADGRITEEEITKRARKILKAKFRVGLGDLKAISLNNLEEDLNTKETELLIRNLLANAITIARDENEILPFRSLDHHQFASLSIGAGRTDFQRGMARYAKLDDYWMDKDSNQDQFDVMEQKLRTYSTVVVGLHDLSRYGSKNHGVTEAMIDFLSKLERNTKVILVVFGSPYALQYFGDISTAVVAYQDDPLAHDLTSQILFGGIPAKGKLPVSASPAFPYGAGFGAIEQPLRFEYCSPEQIGIAEEDLAKIDLIANEAIADKATPGCQILVAKDGHVIYQKSFGFHTYDKQQAVQNTDLYDIASLTKIAGSLMGVMDMYDSGFMQMNHSLSKHLPKTVGTNKAKLTIGSLLTHEAGLRSWIPFYESTIVDDATRRRLYSSIESDQFQVQVAENMYMRQDQQDEMWKKILASDLPNKNRYKYSDLGFYFLKEIIENHNETPFHIYLQARFYQKLGLARTSFLPLEKFTHDDIVPTEDDSNFRRQLLDGYVHDMGAAMFGGVGGHAGLFSNANDLAKIMQMFVNGGEYGGDLYFEPNTVDYFSRKQGKRARRGYGFDRPEPGRDKGPTCNQAPASSFGHTGFTGTMAWADPENNLVYIFLSNRVYPDSLNWKLVRNNIRTRIQEVIYLALAKSKQKTAN